MICIQYCYYLFSVYHLVSDMPKTDIKTEVFLCYLGEIEDEICFVFFSYLDSTVVLSNKK